MSSVFICQARSLFIEYFVALEIKRSYLRILCKKIILAIISILSLPDLSLTWAQLFKANNVVS